MTNLLCNLGIHTVMPSKLWNDGHYFSVCARCKKDMIRTPNGRWMRVPTNMKVVWRRRTEDDIVWPTHLL